MHQNTILLVIIAALAGFIGGFWLANSINRSAIMPVGSQPDPATASNSNRTQTKGEADLTDDEIKAKIAEADRNPTSSAFQKELGMALYTYAVMKKNPSLFPEAVRILERAVSLNPKDFDVLVALGNAHFDTGYAEKNLAEFQRAREVYSKALDLKPGDADVETDLGISYAVQVPPAYDKAAAQLQKVIDTNPKHERALIYLVRALAGQTKLPDAEKALAKLKTIDPNNDSIFELTSLIADARSGAKK